MFYAMGHFSKFVGEGSVRIKNEMNPVDDRSTTTCSINNPKESCAKIPNSKTDDDPHSSSFIISRLDINTRLMASSFFNKRLGTINVVILNK